MLDVVLGHTSRHTSGAPASRYFLQRAAASSACSHGRNIQEPLIPARTEPEGNNNGRPRRWATLRFLAGYRLFLKSYSAVSLEHQKSMGWTSRWVGPPTPHP
eukprot:559163-Pelagomonas_calceolata.AAC.1